MSDTININGANYTVCSFRGKVLRNHTYTTSETTVSGDGSSATLYKGTGRIKQKDIQTYTTHTHHTGLYLQDDKGNQDVTNASGIRLNALEGHDVIAIWIVREGDDRGSVVGFLNITLRQYYWRDKTWQEFHRHTVWIALLQMSSIFIAIGVAFYFGRLVRSWLIFWALLIGVFIGIWRFTGRLEDENRQRVLTWQEEIDKILAKRYAAK